MTTDPWFFLDEDGYPSGSFNRERLVQARWGQLRDQRDLDAALTLLEAIGNWVEAWCGGDTDEDSYITEDALRTLQAICHRLGIPADLTSNLSVSGSRRRHHAVWEMLEPVHRDLLSFERNMLARELEDTGWPAVEDEIKALRAVWRRANSVQDYSSVGNHAVRVLEVLSDVVGDDDVPRDRTKNRLMGYFDIQSAGNANADLKKLVTHAVDLAQGVKHDREPSRLKAGSAASAAILLVSMARTAAEPN